MVKKLEVDQSVRIEELTKDTILGIANEQVSFTAIVPKRVKRALHEEFRRQGKPKKFAPYVFATAVSALIQRMPFKSSVIVIDIECPGYEQEILEIVKQCHPQMEVYFTVPINILSVSLIKSGQLYQETSTVASVGPYRLTIFANGNEDSRQLYALTIEVGKLSPLQNIVSRLFM